MVVVEREKEGLENSAVHCPSAWAGRLIIGSCHVLIRRVVRVSDTDSANVNNLGLDRASNISELLQPLHIAYFTGACEAF